MFTSSYLGVGYHSQRDCRVEEGDLRALQLRLVELPLVVLLEAVHRQDVRRRVERLAVSHHLAGRLALDLQVAQA